MISIEINNNEDSSKEERDQENENTRLSETNVVEYSNYDNKKKHKKNWDFYYKIIIVVLMTAFIFSILFYINSKVVDIIYEDRSNNIYTNINGNNTSNQEIIEINDLKNKKQQKKNDIINIKENVENVDDPTKIKEIIEQNDIKENSLYNNGTKKIGLAFVYNTLYSNGIARFLTLTANYLMKTGKYDICFITGKPFHKEYSYNSSIKRFIGNKNYTLIRELSKTENIDFFILQNTLLEKKINFYKSLGKKVIGMFHGVYMSAMFHGSIKGYRNWINFDLYDSFVFLSHDDYYFYKNLGFKNEIYIPNLYTFEPSETKNSNLTNHNIMMLGRQNDPIKGSIYAVQAMKLIVKEVPDAKLYLITSDSRVQFIKNLREELNLTDNIFIIYHTYNISDYFWNSSVHMFTSLSEAFPMAMNEGKAHGLPIVAFDVPYSPPYQNGVIVVDQLDIESLARETIHLLKDYNYRKKMGELAKNSLNNYSNKETVELWGRLFNSLLRNNINDYRELQNEIEKKYYNEEKAKIHMQKHYNALLKYNKNFTCHTLENFTNINYIKNIKECIINSI